MNQQFASRRKLFIHSAHGTVGVCRLENVGGDRRLLDDFLSDEPERHVRSGDEGIADQFEFDADSDDQPGANGPRGCR